MKPSTLVSLVAALFFWATDSALAQTCDAHPILPLYETVKEQDIPALDDLSDADKAVLEGVYATAQTVVTEYAQHKLGSPVPTEIINNLPNFKKIIEGDNLEGSLGIYSNIVGAISPRLGEILPNMWRETLTALGGTPVTTAELEDANNRKIVSTQLKKDGCTGTLTLPPYRSPPPATPLYYGKADFCDQASYQAKFRQGDPDGEDFHKSDFEGDKASCSYYGGKFKYTVHETPYYAIWSSLVETTVYIEPSESSAFAEFEKYQDAFGCEKVTNDAGKLLCAGKIEGRYDLAVVHKNALVVISGSFVKEDQPTDLSSAFPPLATETLKRLIAK